MNKPISGMMIYYYIVCSRKLWYFYHQITMEQNHENVKIGKILDEETYAREDKHINIDNIINIDFIRARKILHEVKKSKKIEQAGIWQIKYYLYYLKQRGVTDLKGKVDYPLLKQSEEIELTVEDEKQIEQMITDIYKIVNEELGVPLNRLGICKECAYYDLCFI